jgi:very-short-patch-repair endonuclease
MWRRERLVVEIDGYNYHSGPAIFHRDHEKDILVREAGLEMLRCTGDHVLHQPAMVLVRVAQTFARLTGD